MCSFHQDPTEQPTLPTLTERRPMPVSLALDWEEKCELSAIRHCKLPVPEALLEDTFLLFILQEKKPNPIDIWYAFARQTDRQIWSIQYNLDNHLKCYRINTYSHSNACSRTLFGYH